MLSRAGYFVEQLKLLEPGFNTKFKTDSWLMKVLAFVLFFMNFKDFTTTIGATVYLPSQEALDKANHNRLLPLLAHEFTHAREPFYQSALYLMPQLLVLLMPLLFLLVPWYLALLGLLFLAPLPAYWRKEFEYRGYGTTLFVYDLLLQEQGMSILDREERLIARAKDAATHFTGKNYYFMWPFGQEERLINHVGEILHQNPISYNQNYREIAQALENSK